MRIVWGKCNVYHFYVFNPYLFSNMSITAQFTYLSTQVIDSNLSLTAQFTYLSNQVIDRNDDKIIGVPDANNITDCARLCVTNPGFTCNSFDFCALDQAHICRLSKAHIGDGGVTLVNSTTCDHFSSEYSLTFRLL